MSFFNNDEIYEYIVNIDPQNSDNIVDIALRENRIKYNEISDYYYIYTRELLEKHRFDIVELTSNLCDYLGNYLRYTLLFEKDIDYIIIGRKRFQSDGKILLTKDTVCGILIAQKGECVEYPTYWTIRLICNLSEPMCKNYGTKLLGAYMLMLVKMKEKDPSNYQKYGVLELAGSYTNLAGYCAYSKLGFIENYNFECTAFDTHNLLMTSNVDELTIEDIYNTVRENTRFKQNRMTGNSEKTVKRPICLYQNTKFKNSIITKLEGLRSRSLPTKKLYTEETLTAEENQIINEIINKDLTESKILNEDARSASKRKVKEEKELLELLKGIDIEDETRTVDEDDEEFLKILEELDLDVTKGKKKLDERLEYIPRVDKKEYEKPTEIPKKIYDPEREERKFRELLSELGIDGKGKRRSRKRSIKRSRKRMSRKRSIKRRSRKRSIKKNKKRSRK